MKCPKCQKDILNQLTICPYCGESLPKNIGEVSKNIHSKINEPDSSSLVGGTVSKGAFIKFSKKTPKKDIYLNNYNNYIDYKEAKEKELEKFEQNSKKHYISPLVNSIIEKEDDKKTEKEAFINVVSIDKKTSKKSFNFLNVFAYLGVITVWILAILLVIKGPQNRVNGNYYFHESNENKVSSNSSNANIENEMSKYTGVSKSGQTTQNSTQGITSIVYDNQYTKQFTIHNNNEVAKLIASDSVKQKSKCPANIIKLENEIIENYGITAVNLCEMDEEFAKELVNVVKYIYEKYPTARNYLTNLTLANVENNQTYIAAFMPIFTFAVSNTTSGYPVAVKTQILLNAKYFLNNSKIKSSVDYGSKSGYFPKNATRSSTVAHEFGHYLSYIALLNNYESKQLNFIKVSNSNILYKVYDDFNAGTFSYKILVEAYNKYKETNPNISFNQFRQNISTYAIAKNNKGSYIYDETIAEAFHDVYLNGSNANYSSICIVNVLEQKL